MNQIISYRIKAAEKMRDKIAARIQDINEIVKKAVEAASEE